jgi:hypothetical protein
MNPRERVSFARALRFALAAHGDQKRRGTQIPYVSHLVQVAGLVLEHGGDAEQAIAGLLHDAIEDCEGVTEAGLRERFGPEVARIVRAVSDVVEGDTQERKSPWLLRKRRFVAHLQPGRARAASSPAATARQPALARRRPARGRAATLARFRGTPAQILVLRGGAPRARERAPGAAQRELDALVAELARFVPEADPEVASPRPAAGSRTGAVRPRAARREQPVQRVEQGRVAEGLPRKRQRDGPRAAGAPRRRCRRRSTGSPPALRRAGARGRSRPGRGTSDVGHERVSAAPPASSSASRPSPASTTS